jgi:hypothetical protein
MLADNGRSCREAHRKLKLYSEVNFEPGESREDKNSCVDAVLGVCCTRGMLYTGYAVLGICCIRYMLYSVSTHDHDMEEIVSNDLTLCSAMMVEWWMRKRAMGGEDANNVEHTSGFGNSGVCLA